jgi:hypothetical protein
MGELLMNITKYDELLSDVEMVLNEKEEEIDEFGDDRVEQERNAICWLRWALEEGIEVTIMKYHAQCTEIYKKKD